MDETAFFAPAVVPVVLFALFVLEALAADFGLLVPAAVVPKADAVLVPVVAGFAGSTADAFTLLERLEKKLEAAPGQLARACVDLAKDWRMDKYLRNLEAMLIVTDGADLYVITGAGDVLEPEHDVAAIGSGGNFALAAARGLMATDLPAEDVARRAMAIAADICVYTNGNLTVERIAK